MRAVSFLLLMAVAGYGAGSLVGWGLSEREVREAMCSYYSEWEFCKKTEKENRLKDLAISGLSRKVHELEMKLKEREKEREMLCVKAYRLNIRLYPLDGKVIGIYRKGAKVRILDRIGGWARTEEGWVSERWLERCPEAEASSPSGGAGLPPSPPPPSSKPVKGKAGAGAVSAGGGNSDVLRK